MSLDLLQAPTFLHDLEEWSRALSLLMFRIPSVVLGLLLGLFHTSSLSWFCESFGKDCNREEDDSTNEPHVAPGTFTEHRREELEVKR